MRHLGYKYLRLEALIGEMYMYHNGIYISQVFIYITRTRLLEVSILYTLHASFHVPA